MTTRPAIETYKLTKSYGAARGVVDLTLTVEPGTIFGFLGPNGAGKTTLIRLLMDFIRPTSGSAQVFGLDCQQDSLEIKRRSGYLPAEPVIYGHLSARMFLEYSRALNGSDPLLEFESLARRFDLELDKPLAELSRGNRQKVAIVNAFMGQPDLLIMDEPTSGLDPLIQQEFYALMGQCRDQGKTIFFSSHVLSEVDRMCDRVGVVRDGRLVAVHSVADLKKHALRRLEILFDEPVDASEFLSLQGVETAVVTGRRLDITLTGALQPVIEVAAHRKIIDIRTEEATLEDTFFHLYRRSGDSNA